MGQIHPFTIPQLSTAGPWQWFAQYQHYIGYCVKNIWCTRRFGQVLGNIRNINVIRQAFSRTVNRNIRYHFWARNGIHMKMEEPIISVRHCALHHNTGVKSLFGYRTRNLTLECPFVIATIAAHCPSDFALALCAYACFVTRSAY